MDSSRTIEAPAIIGSIRELEEWSKAQESPRPVDETSVSSGRAADGDDSNHHVRGYAFGSVEDIVYGSNQNSAGLPIPIRRHDSGGLSVGNGYSTGGKGGGGVMRDLEEEQLLHPLGVQPAGDSQLHRRQSHLDRYGKRSRKSLTVELGVYMCGVRVYWRAYSTGFPSLKYFRVFRAQL